MSQPTDRLTAALDGRYRIERRLGEGGMATVYLAEDVKHERKVALKILRPELAAVIGAERFLSEIRTTANLQHPHILALFDSGAADGFLYYVMPYIEGETLRGKLDRERQLGVDEAVRIASEVADALDYAHRQGVIHRDIKPENILLHDGRPVVADFGIALAVSAAGGGRMTETGLSLGTPHYMSPEQATADRDLSSRSDVYSLGCILYEMLTGDPPHMGPTAQSVLMRILTETPRPVTEVRTTVPPNVASTVAKALEKLPADRFESARAFIDALDDASFTHTAHAPKPLADTRVQAAAVTPRGGLSPRLTLALGVSTIVLAMAAAFGWMRILTAPDPIVTRMAVSLTEDGSAVENPVLSPDGSFILFNKRGELLIMRRQLDELEATPLRGTEAGDPLDVSPDGQSVLFRRPGSGLEVVSLAGGPPVRVGGGRSGQWGPDGSVYLTPGTFGVWRAATPGAEPEELFRQDSASGFGLRYAEPLPGGKGILLTLWYGSLGEAQVGVLDLQSGSIEPLLEGTEPKYASTGHLVYVRADGALMAASFDEESLTVTGPSVPVAEGVAVSPQGNADYDIAENGSLVYSTGSVGGGQSIVRVSRGGVENSVDPALAGRFNTLALSPDETRLAVSVDGEGGQDLWVKTLDRGPFTRLTFEGALNYRPRWSADGSSILFVTNRLDGTSLFTKLADGSRPAELFYAFGRSIAEGHVTGDSTLILRTFPGTDLSRDILYVPHGDSVPVPFVNSPFDEQDLAVSPDGRWVAYAASDQGRPEIFVRPFPAGDARWQVSTEGGRFPHWAHSGEELFYGSDSDQLMRVAVSTNPSFQAQAPEPLFSTADYRGGNYSYDVSQDDQTFYFIKQEGGEEGGTTVLVLNWFEELKARAGR